MEDQFIKLLTPVLIFGAWIFFTMETKSVLLMGTGLFFASYASISSNYTFVYREIYQLLQILLTVVFIIRALHKRIISRINLIFVVLLGFIGVSLIFAPLDNNVKSQLMNYLVAASVANYIFISIRSTKDLENVLFFVARLAVILASLGLLEFLYNPESRVEVTFSNPNYYGFFLGIGFCVVFIKWNGWPRNIALVIIVFAIIMSGSRSAVAFPVLQSIWVLYRKLNFRKVITMVTSLMLIITFIIYSGLTRFNYTNLSDSSNMERIIYAKIALRMANNHQLTGVGWGRYISEFSNYSSLAEQVITTSGVVDVSEQESRVTHNDYLRILAELGWIAFFMAIIISVYGIRLIIINYGFGLEYLPPIWIGLLLFSFTHNNMNNALFWFLFLLPFFLNEITVRRQMGWQYKGPELRYSFAPSGPSE